MRKEVIHDMSNVFPTKKTDKMTIVELHLGEPLRKYLCREYSETGISITRLTKILNKKTGFQLERSTIWKWLKFYNIRRKTWKK